MARSKKSPVPLFTALLACLFLTVSLSQWRLANRPINDNDEGIYATTLMLIDKGYPAYRQTFLSQPPGFVIGAFPVFKLLGGTLPAGRIAVGLWSLAGLLAVVWAGRELGSKWIGLLAAGLVYLMPVYSRQTLTLQSDALAASFSVISLAAWLRFYNRNQTVWLAMAVFFFNLAVWTKLDLSVLAPAAIMAAGPMLKKKIFPAKTILTALAVSAVFFIFFILPFGFIDMLKNVAGLRIQAAGTSPAVFRQYLTDNTLLAVALGGGLILSLLDKPSVSGTAVASWPAAILVLLFFYRPLFPHHLSMLAIPAALLLSFSVWRQAGNKPVLPYFAAAIVLTAAVLRIYAAVKTPTGILNPQQREAAAIIYNLTGPQDYIVSDEQILNSVTRRIPPPSLADISHVRINSGNINARDFEAILKEFRPKIVVAWNGRLDSMPGFKNSLSDYHLLKQWNNSKKMYIRKE